MTHSIPTSRRGSEKEKRRVGAWGERRRNLRLWFVSSRPHIRI
jgi:hypothetical protein